MRSNREYDYFGNVLEYEYDYFPSYSSTSTSTQKVLVLEYEYDYTSTITPYHAKQIVMDTSISHKDANANETCHARNLDDRKRRIMHDQETVF